MHQDVKQIGAVTQIFFRSCTHLEITVPKRRYYYGKWLEDEWTFCETLTYVFKLIIVNSEFLNEKYYMIISGISILKTIYIDQHKTFTFIYYL